MASADVVPANTDVGLHRFYDDIDRTLSLRREQLEKEVDDFRQQKEQEFKQFEEQLRGTKLLPRSYDTAGENGQTAQTEPSDEETNRPILMRLSSDERRLHRKPITARQALDLAFRSTHDEAHDLEGVFTPDFLPLINGNKRASTGSLQPPPTGDSDDAKISASATLHPPLLYPGATSPLQTMAVSSSAPEQSSAKSHHRSDSANSVSSLRSSLKDPKTPKSPKRVLFSIEDGVVSPSTSPALSRKAVGLAPGEGDAMESMFRFAKRAGREKKRRNRRKERGDGDRGRMGREEHAEVPPQPEIKDFPEIQEGWSKPLAVNLRQPPDRPNLVHSSAAAEDYEQIEKGDGDELFTFDEDLEQNEAGNAADSKDEILEENENAAHRALTELGTSPHAGSLPIEIKWPGRRDSGGAG